ncbi:MAG: hypothetical protein GC160_29620 [Acidobacteria bacterium]|nr:hypothetical protein [Acidobacteriota bacterium]
MPGFSIVTNVNSLLAQENLGRTNELQTRTIQRLTSGLRINSSSDDAAGLAVANRFRSDIAVLQQGIRNGSDGLSTLQTIDGGLNNISLLIDRARTLATQSASGTFTGDRGTLNSEFQSVIEEINRQAQAIGLDAGGAFNASLSVFIGGGRSNGGVNEVQNGAVNIDLTNSAVGGQQLGLQGVRALGGVEGTTDIGNSSVTSVENIIGNATNASSLTTAGFTEFVFTGPGFADDGKASLSVNLSGVVDAGTLVTAINNAIEGFSATSSAGEAFKDAGIKAVVNTDSTGKQQLAFTSSDTAFQVRAGDLTSNALLGNFNNASVSGQGASLTVRVQSGTASGDASATNTDTIKVKVSGGGLTSPQTVSFTLAGSETQAEVFSALESAFASNSALSSAGFAVSGDTANDLVNFTNAKGQKFEVLVSGDSENLLGFGSAQLDGSGNTTFNTITSGSALDVSVDADARLTIKIEGSSTPQTIDVSVRGNNDADVTTTTAQGVVDQINQAIANNSTLSAGGFKASLSGGALKLESTTGTEFQLLVDESRGGSFLGLGTSNTTVDGTAITAGTLFGGAGQNTVGVQFAADTDGDTVADATVTGTLNVGYVGGNVTAAAADETGTISFTVTNQRTGVSYNIVAAVGNSDDSDAVVTSLGTAIDTALGANVIEVTNGGGGATNPLEFAAGASANDNDLFSFTDVTYTNTGGTASFALGVANGTDFEIEPINEQRIAARLQAAADANSSLNAAGVTFTADAANNTVDVTSLSSISFTGTDQNTNVAGFVSGLAQVATDVDGSNSISGGTLTEQGTFKESTVNAGGSQATQGSTVDDPTVFSNLFYGNDAQNIVVTANNANGSVQSLNINLSDSNARNLDEAISAINTALQQSNNSTLQSVVAVKERLSSTTDGIRFISSLTDGFSVNVGASGSAHGINSGTSSVLSSSQLDGGSVADISSKENAANAVTLLASAVSLLGSIQADVGRGQNRLQFAISLATTQITNISAAESRIRDADLAQEAANLTRAGIAQQAGVAALAQANSAPQAVLALLRG